MRVHTNHVHSESVSSKASEGMFCRSQAILRFGFGRRECISRLEAYLDHVRIHVNHEFSESIHLILRETY